MPNEFDVYASLTPAKKKAFHGQRAGQNGKNRGFAKIGYRDPIDPHFHEGPGPIAPLGDVQSHMPKGGSSSPTGDLSDLKQREAVAVFPVLRKTGSRAVKASQEIPAPTGWRKQ